MTVADRKMELPFASRVEEASTSLSGDLKRVLRSIARRIGNRIALNALADFDERQLADIGLTRRDVKGARDTGFFGDPGGYLHAAAQVRARDRFNRISKI